MKDQYNHVVINTTTTIAFSITVRVVRFGDADTDCDADGATCRG
jgi:hypothetical protein